MQQASQYFEDESDSLAKIIAPLKDAEFEQVTLFKDWTINDVLGHLHLWNIAADITLNRPDDFVSFLTGVGEKMQSGMNHQSLTRNWLAENDIAPGRDLYDEWIRVYREVAASFSSADPDKRVRWGGPDMSVRSCIIARQMETWAHGQAVFDVLGEERANTDRLKSVAHIGVTTYRWSFQANGQEAPMPKPFVQLTSPSGELWEWNEEQADNKVSGDAVEFCQVVTQCRAFADTKLKTVGDNAAQWMAIAQCFAGGAETPPTKGQRRKAG